MEIILTGIISGLISSAVVIYYSRYIQYKRYDRLRQTAEDLLDEMEERVVRARIEFFDTYMMVYDRDTDQFLAQGKTWEEINDILMKRFPNKLFDVNQQQIEKAMTYNNNP